MKSEHWSCTSCRQRIVTHVELKQAPTCSNKHKPTEMVKVK